MREQKEIALSNLMLDTAQSRKVPWEGDKKDERLLSSIEQDGVLHPLIVRPVSCTSYADDVDEDYAIIAGSRRFEAATRAGLDTVSCLVTEADDATAAAKSLRENLDRKDLTDVEKAQSIRFQFELNRPPETTECPGDCDYTIEREAHRAFSTHLEYCDASLEFYPEETGHDSNHDRFLTDTHLITYLATTFFDGPEQRQREKVKRCLELSEMPAELQSLWKSEESLTHEERQALSEYDISQEVNIAGGGNSLSKRVADLYSEFARSSDEVNTTDATLEVIGRLDGTVEGSKTLSDEIADYTEKVSEQLDSDTGHSDRVVISEVLKSKLAELTEITEEIGSKVTIGQTRITFDNHKYHRWHGMVKQERGVEADSAAVREGYKQYLDEMAEKHGWD